MNKIKTMAIATLACVALCGTTMAAPAHRGGGKPPAPARQHQKAPPPKPAQKHGHAVARHHAPAPAHRHHAPAPRPCQPPPPPHLECHHDEASGLAVLGAALIGGIVGAICN